MARRATLSRVSPGRHGCLSATVSKPTVAAAAETHLKALSAVRLDGSGVGKPESVAYGFPFSGSPPIGAVSCWLREATWYRSEGWIRNPSVESPLGIDQCLAERLLAAGHAVRAVARDAGPSGSRRPLRGRMPSALSLSARPWASTRKPYGRLRHSAGRRRIAPQGDDPVHYATKIEHHAKA